MKKLMLVVVCFVLVGCTGLGGSGIKQTPLDTIQEASIGDVLFDYQKMTLTNPTKFNLMIVALTKSNITLQYTEYFAPKDFATGLPKYGTWVIKAGFNTRLEYPLGSGVIRYKSFEFKVLSVDNCTITYKRTK